MSHLAHVYGHIRRGCYLDALKALDTGRHQKDARLESEVLRAELLERTGRYTASRESLTVLLRSTALPQDLRSRCEVTLGLIDSDEGFTSDAVFHIQRSIALAKSAKDLHQECVCQLRLVVLLSDSQGHAAAAPSVSHVRANVTRLGDAQITAMLHILMGQIDAKRGLIHPAKRHTEVGLRLLQRDCNSWLAAVAENTLAAVGFLSSDFAEGIRHGQVALRLAEESGAAAMRRATLANLGNLYYQIGDFAKALEHFEKTRHVLPNVGESHNGGLDSLAQVKLTENKLSDAAAYIGSIDAAVSKPDDWLRYGNRHSRITKAAVLLRQGKLAESAAAIRDAESLAALAGDRLLATSAKLLNSERLVVAGDYSIAAEELGRLGSSFKGQAPHIFANYQRVLGAMLARAFCTCT